MSELEELFHKDIFCEAYHSEYPDEVLRVHIGRYAPCHAALSNRGSRAHFEQDSVVLTTRKIED